MFKSSVLTLFITSALSSIVYGQNQYIDRQVKDLLARMTVEEKIAQLQTTWSMAPRINEKVLRDTQQMRKLFGQGIGMINPDFDNTPEQQVKYRNIIQNYLRTKTRLCIPAIFIDESHHGLLGQKADVFPTSIGLACSWDTSLAKRIYTYIAAQASSRGTNLVLAPVIDVTRDPRWGRTGETYGEDPYFNGTFGSAVVQGFQGSADGSIAIGHVAATLKHFTGHGQPEGGVNQAPADYSTRVLYTYHMEPFRIAIANSHPSAIMPSYLDIDGIPASANHWLLTDVLRKEWNYNGVLVSDWWAIDQLYQKHMVATDRKHAALEAFKAGMTVDDPMGANYGDLVSLVKEGKISMVELDKAVGYVLTLKFKLGLFEKTAPISLENANRHINQPEGRTLALKAAEESMVLLKNENHILPLKADQYKKIAVIGPCAAVDYTGDYSGQSVYNVSLLQGVRNYLKAANSKTEVVYAKGVDLTKNGDTLSYNNFQIIDPIVLPDKANNLRKIDSAVAIAKDADIIFCALGENEQFSREAQAPKHYGDMAELNLQSQQDDLLKALIATGKPVIVYLSHGRPLCINYVQEKANAILDGWYTGEESGNAAANIIFGEVNPSGKLTISVPRNVGQIPIYYNHKPSAQFLPYVTESNTPLYSFGYGLSYTNYHYGKPTLSGDKISVQVTNSGGVSGDEIIQLYVHPKIVSVTQPVKALKGFQRIHLNAGESKTISFAITKDMLAYYGPDMKRVAEPGDYELMIGPGSQEVQTVVYKVK